MTSLMFAAIFLALSSPAHAEDCRLLSNKSQIAPIQLTLDGSAPLNTLPEDASAVACPRASLVPRQSDVRVLTEWGVALGLVESGPRTLWIYAADGRLKVTVDDGELTPAEAAAVRDWLEKSQTLFDAALSNR
jgi:hypothetical protein